MMHLRIFELGVRVPLAIGAACLALLHSSCAGGGGGSGGGGGGPISLGFQQVGGQFLFPVFLTAPPGDPRLFVLEKGGTIRVVENGQQLPIPFLDISALVSQGDEQGLLGMAFAPDYATSGRFYLDYTDLSGSTVIARYLVSAADPNLADPVSAEPFLSISRPGSNHNGGMIAFGRDGYLYIALGDGESQPSGQDATDLLGSILRIDVSGASGYAVPAGNPYASGGGAPEVWSFGLRNPWRFSFDRQNGDLYIADVGEGAFEEIDVSPVSSGGGRETNYGWSIMQGTACHIPPFGCNQTGLEMPVLAYTHADGCSVTGGYVYRGTAIPGLGGAYFYGDYCTGFVKSFRYNSGQATELTTWPNVPPGNITSFGEDAAGEMYIVTASNGIFRIIGI